MSELFDETPEAISPEPSLPLPGATLRAAREAHGYSLTEISQALKFGVRQLEALESDDYSTLKGATFIRGFVRSYARYLRLDEAPLLAALEPQAPVVVSEVRAVESMGAAMPSRSQDSSRRVYWLAAIVLLLGGVAWFAWQGQTGAVPRAKPVEPTPASTAPESAMTGAVQTPVVKPSTGSSPQAVPALSTPTVIAAPAAASAPTEALPALASDAQVQPAVNANERQLLLSFSGVSWVEIRDASNRILYSGNSTPDTRQSLRGRPPFQLVIGNAQSVKLRYEDRNIDLQPYTRVDVARLTLDDNTK